MTNGQSAQLKKAFLNVFRQSGNVSQACAAAGVKRRGTVYDWQEKDEQFLAEYRQAEIEATENLEAEAHRRAVFGVKKYKGVYHNGALLEVVEETDYSDTLLIFLLKARAPLKYRDNVAIEHAGPGGTPQRVEVIYTDRPAHLPAAASYGAAEDQG